MVTSVNTLTQYRLIDGAKSISAASFPEEAWTTTSGDTTKTSAEKFYAAEPFLFRCIEVRANSLITVPWTLTSIGSDIVLWSSKEEEPPDDLVFLSEFVDLLWRTEASLCLLSQAFWGKGLNGYNYATAARWFDPNSMTPVWDEKDGLTKFKRQLSKRSVDLPVEEVVYFWLKGQSETKPRPAPAEVALLDAGVLYNMNVFASDFFKRGAVKMTLLTVPPTTTKEQKDLLKAWWDKLVSGVRNAFKSAVISADVVPQVIGEGVGELGNSNLTTEKRQAIATGLGVPHSLVMSDAANYATSQQDETNFYNMTIIPDAKLIARTLNRQLFAPLGLDFIWQPDEMAVFQEDETNRADAVSKYVAAGMKLSVAAQILGVDLPEGMEYEELDPAPELAPMITMLPNAQPPQLQDNQPLQDMPPSAMPKSLPAPSDAWQAEARRFRAWAKKRLGKANGDIDLFDSDLLTDAEKAAIVEKLHDGEAIEVGCTYSVEEEHAMITAAARVLSRGN